MIRSPYERASSPELIDLLLRFLSSPQAQEGVHDAASATQRQNKK
jgi:hypothetical protein